MPSFLYKNLNVHYSDQGTGNCIVLLHGFLEDLSMWDGVVEALKKTHRVICIDLFGHGKTGNLGYIHTMEDQGKMIKHLLDSLSLTRYALVGHSMGGYIALAFAEMYPEQTCALCLMNSTALADDEEKKINRDRGIRAVKQNHKTFIRLAIPNLFSEENRSIFSKEIIQITDVALKMNPQGIIAALEGMKIRNDRTKLLETSKFPILMIISKKDPALDYNSLLTQSTLGKVKKVVFDDGHMSHVENELSLISSLEKFAASILE
jgi:pimeloyl-ACP methyl ester carboxylesterase